MKFPLKIILFIILTAAILFFIYWLWQRQPRSQFEEKIYTPTVSVEKNTQEKTDLQTNRLITSPKEEEILISDSITLKGQTEENGYIAIISNGEQKILKKDQGKNDFAEELSLSSGINIFRIFLLNPELKSLKDETYYFYSLKNNDDKNARIAVSGTVKNIFENALTINANGKEKNIELSKNTKIALSSQKPALKDEKNDIRVGDFTIILATQSNNQIKALSIEIFRENKPQAVKDLTSIEILSPVSKNVFSARNISDSKTIDFTINTETDIISQNQKPTAKDIVKGKKAIIVSSEAGGKKTADLVYILP